MIFSHRGCDRNSTPRRCKGCGASRPGHVSAWMKCTPECSVSGLTRAAQQVDHWPSRYIDCTRLVEKCTNNPRRRGLRSDTLRTRADAQVEAPNHHTIIIEIAARAKTHRICKSPGREGCDPTDVCRDLSKKKKFLARRRRSRMTEGKVKA
jgi:hypothetical protein